MGDLEFDFKFENKYILHDAGNQYLYVTWWSAEWAKCASASLVKNEFRYNWKEDT